MIIYIQLLPRYLTIQIFFLSERKKKHGTPEFYIHYGVRTFLGLQA